MSDQSLAFVIDADGKGAVDTMIKKLSSVDLKENLDTAIRSLSTVFADAPSLGEFGLAEVTVGLQIGADGGVSFVGSAKVQASSTLTLKFAARK